MGFRAEGLISPKNELKGSQILSGLRFAGLLAMNGMRSKAAGVEVSVAFFWRCMFGVFSMRYLLY